MRIKKQLTDIDYEKTHSFFAGRAKKFAEDHPYTTTMYQDNNVDLVNKRNRLEKERLLPLLNINPDSRVLDIGCGIGRWADSLPDDIQEYCGVDFSEDLIEIAKKRNQREHFSFHVGAAYEIEKILEQTDKGKFNRVLMIGILMYLNDTNMQSLLQQIDAVCEEHATICIREPIAQEDRLTLKDVFSEELKDDYNAIYRTDQELTQAFEKSFLHKGFRIKEKNPLFDKDTDANNRKETFQYYYILER